MANLTGTELGKYQVLERLGSGGMAEVYKGYHPTLDRYVAIKILHGYLAEGEDFLARFEREARAVANLRHPNIVQIHDFDIQGDHYYMVMEFIGGGTLSDLIKNVQNHIDLKQILSIMKQIASALDYAHNQGIIHRDIKPSNILITADNQALLTDFGIARIASSTQFTATGALVGTPAYMSPEQCKGEKIDKVSDIYSLGVILFEMLTGSIPYNSETPLSVLQKHIAEPIPRIHNTRKDLSYEFEAIIQRAMAKQAEDRYHTASELVDDLQQAIEHAKADTKEIKLELEQAPEADETTLETVIMEEEIAEKTETPKPKEPAEEEAESQELPQLEDSAPLPGEERQEIKPYEKSVKSKKQKNIPWKYLIPAIAVVAGVIALFATGILSGANCEEPWVCRELAIKEWDSGNPNQAAKYYRQAISLAEGPFNEFAPIYCEYTELGWQLDLDDRFAYEAACFLGEKNVTGCELESCSEFAYMAWEEGRLWAAAELFSLAADGVPDEDMRHFAYLWCERAEVYRQLGEPELAEQNQVTCEAWESN